ncbi:MAG: NUDIX hydrolase [Rhodobacteraceae bacterium]|nr:NUDIX hydrolase [Paracoccaceae bacterium]
MDKLPLKKVARKAGPGTQFAALCYRRRKGKDHEILLVTTRGTGRWIPPKGWPMKGVSPDKAAAREAWEEAGVVGEVHEVSLGRYSYTREASGDGKGSQEAYIFPLEVLELATTFKEKGQRKVRWFSPRKAAMLVREPKLKKIIRDFDPAKLS